MSTAQAESRELVAALQEKKAPLEAERVALYAELEAALDGPRSAEAEVRTKIKAVNDKIRPIDESLSAADGVKFLKDDEIRAQVVAKIRAKIGG